jgi:hypothetical protein
MLSWRHSLGKRSPLESLAEDAKSIPRFRCYASPPPTETCTPLHLGLIAELPRKTLPAIARAVSLDDAQPLHPFLAHSPW